MVLILAGAALVAALALLGTVVSGWTGEPSAREAGGGVWLELAPGVRIRLGLTLLSGVAALWLVALHEWLSVAGPSRPYGLPLTFGVCGLVLGAYGVSAFWRGFGRVRFDPAGLAVQPPLGRTLELAWRDLDGVAEGKRRVVAGNRNGTDLHLAPVPGWSVAQTAQVLDFYADHAGERAELTSAIGLRARLEVLG